MRTKLVSIIMMLALFGLTPVCFADSTQLAPPNTKTVMPIASINTGDCVEATIVSATVNPIQGGNTNASGTVSNCPMGYVAYGMNAAVSIPGKISMTSSTYSWQTNCCRAVVTYQTPA